jgi:hypothetical protein
MNVFAEQLTLLDVHLFRSIQPKDMIFYLRKQKRAAKSIEYECLEEKI